jgi:hypothetical protein
VTLPKRRVRTPSASPPSSVAVGRAGITTDAGHVQPGGYSGVARAGARATRHAEKGLANGWVAPDIYNVSPPIPSNPSSPTKPHCYRRQRTRRLLDYDDLVSRLDDALHDPVRGPAATYDEHNAWDHHTKAAA